MKETTMTTENKIAAEVTDDPYGNRQVEKPISDKGAFVHLLKGSTGSGTLSMPFAFKQAGLAFGTVGTLLVGIICSHCVQILIQSSHTLCRRCKKPFLDYPETARLAFETGPPSLRKFAKTAEWSVKWVLILTAAVGSVYVVLMASTIKQVVENFNPESNMDIRLYMAILWVPLAMVGAIPELKYLVPFSSIASVCIISVYGIVLYFEFGEIGNPAERALVGDISKWPIFFATATFAMEGIGIVMPIENTMANPKHMVGFPGVFFLVMITVITFDIVVGFFGYLRFGEGTEGSITLNLLQKYPNDYAAQVCQYLIAIAVFVSYALVLFAPCATIWEEMKDRIPLKWHALFGTIMRISIVTITVVLAAVVPNLGPMISLVGAVCFSTVGLVIPVILDMVVRWADHPGISNWRFCKNMILLILTTFLMVIGIVTSVVDIISIS